MVMINVEEIVMSLCLVTIYTNDYIQEILNIPTHISISMHVYMSILLKLQDLK